MRKDDVKTISILSILALAIIGFSSSVKAEDNKEKNQEDPTKIVTKIGVSYVDEGLGISGSVGLDEARMLSARVSDDGDEWRIGGSWLFDLGIVNFNYSKTTYDNEDSYKNNYSIGTFMPLSVFGIEPYGIQIFPMAGFSYNDGELLTENKETAKVDDFIITPISSTGGYVGAFSLKPLTEKVTLMAVAGGTLGSDDYSGYWLGGGLSYKHNKHSSINAFAFTVDDDFGKEDTFGVSYKYEF